MNIAGKFGTGARVRKIDRKIKCGWRCDCTGHPVGASGARIVLHLAHILRREKAKKGVATICIGGGQGGAMLIENVSEV